MKTDALEERYPNLSFLLRMDEITPLSFSLHENNLDKEVGSAIKPLKLETLEAVYIYGLGLGYYYFPFKKWLTENKERDLIFIEENLTVLKAFLEMEHAEEILSHPQVHIRFNLDKKRLTSFVEECAQSFPVERIGVVALASYKKWYRSRFYRFRLKLHRQTTIEHALFHENRYYNHFFDNFIPNFHRMENSFDGNGLKDAFKGIPAIVCGAGPSLANDMSTLRTLKEQAIIFAGGSTITALSNQGVIPHFGIAYDPNEEELKRFMAASAFEIPILYASRLHPGIFNTCNGSSGYLHTQTGGWAEHWMEEKLGLKQEPLQMGFTMEALSVTTAALQLACTYGCNPIILVGVDLAFTNNQTYTPGVVTSSSAGINKRKEENRTSEKLLSRKDIYGNPISTLIKWVMESATVSTFVKSNPNFSFINATSGGLGFKNVPNTPLQEIAFPHSYDLYGMVHQAIETHPLPIPPGKIEEQFNLLRESLEKAESYIEIALEELEKVKGKGIDPETGRLIFAQMELETLDAYTVFLRSPSTSFSTLLNRKYRPNTWDRPSHFLKWNFLYSKWSAYKDLIQEHREKI
ncbi:MAG: motility associated factor glycosyltransferase family protein [Simkaniaceae bacterium]|nr:MAG: motility associated factor glycosyltransferase family protein [Simkaniaceae bacterium]